MYKLVNSGIDTGYGGAVGGIGELIEIDDPWPLQPANMRTKQLPMKPAPPVTKIASAIPSSQANNEKLTCSTAFGKGAGRP